MTTGHPTERPLQPLHERWNTMQNLGLDDVVYTTQSIMVGKNRRVEFTCANAAMRVIEELVLYGQALIVPENDLLTIKPSWQINTIYVLGDGRLECKGVWLITQRIIFMTRNRFAQTIAKTRDTIIQYPPEDRVPCHAFAKPTFALDEASACLHPYNGFFTCIQHGDLPFVQFYLAAGKDLGAGPMIPLSLAVQHNQAGVVKLLLAAKAHTEAIDQIGTTPLIYSAMYNSAASAELLIAANANIEARNALGQTAISAAADHSALEVLNLLVAKGANLTTHRPKPDRMSAIVLYATGNGFLETLESLFAQGLNIEVRNSFGDTPLTIAAKYGQTQVVAYLLAQKANIEARGGDGTALESAVQYKHLDIVALLIERDPEAALEFLNEIRPKEDYKIEYFLLSGPRAKTLGLQALMEAAVSKNSVFVGRLLAAGLDVNAQNNDGETITMSGAALMHAVRVGDYETVKLLVEAKAIVQFKDQNDLTLLAHARFALHLMMVEKPSFPDGPRGVSRKAELAQQKDNYEKIIALLVECGAPEGVQQPMQKPTSQKNKSVQFAEGAEEMEEASFAAIETASTVEAVCRAITDITNVLTERGFGYTCAEWLAFGLAVENNFTILANLSEPKLAQALALNQEQNKALPRKHLGKQAVHGETGEQKRE